MKYLIVAHPDDEVIWFHPENYDAIIITFLEREDNLKITEGRYEMKDHHPLKDKIIWLEFHETNYWRDKSKKSLYDQQQLEVSKRLSVVVKNPTLIVTHAADGEYGHSDHILVHKAVTQTFKDCPTVFTDTSLTDQIKETYKEYKCWTWK